MSGGADPVRAAYPWPGDKQSAFCFSVDVDAHSPWLWSNRDGVEPYLSHLEQRRFGPRVGLTRIVEMLGRYAIKGSFFIPAVVAEANPNMLPWLLEQGHEVGLHGYFHELPAQISDVEFSRMLDASIAVFEQQTGRRPGGFRSPAWEMTPHMLAELRDRGFYDSSLMGFDTPYTIDGVTEVPVQWTTDDAIFFKFLGGAGGAERWHPSGTGVVLDAWQREWRAQHRFGTLFMLTVHDWISGRAARIEMLEALLDSVTATPGTWIATVGEVAAHHAAYAAGRDDVASEIPAAVRDHPIWKVTR